MMQFGEGRAHDRSTDAIKTELAKHVITGLRADVSVPMIVTPPLLRWGLACPCNELLHPWRSRVPPAPTLLEQSSVAGIYAARP